MSEPKSQRRMVTVDGNEAVASVAHRTNEVIAIYPITPASPIGEHADAWSAQGRKNIWGEVPSVSELQSEGGAAGAVHGALQAGAVTTTFTASQGLLLMIPNMYKIAGELTSCCIHVAARTIATHALSIFGDHSDVMAARQTGFALLCSANVQEAHDFALIAQAATLKARVPFLHFMDGFRTSHEVAKIEELTDDDLRAMIDDELVRAHRERGLRPERPFIRGTAQNPDTFFQAREACNPFYEACPATVVEAFERFAKLTGREYKLFDYIGHPEAERVIVLMGSGAGAAREAVEHLVAKGEKVGLVIVRLYRPFSLSHMLEALPQSVKSVAVLDRTKEPGSVGEPLYLDVMVALRQAKSRGLRDNEPRVVGGRFGLSSKEFTPRDVRDVLDELSKPEPMDGFSVGIVDDVSHRALPMGEPLCTEPEARVRALFYGLGSDGTVGANKNSIKIIGGETDNHAQGYFVYDSRKAGAITISHLRFGKDPIHSTYLIQEADFVACHQFQFLDKFDLLESMVDGGVFLLNAPFPTDEVWGHLPREAQQAIVDKHLKFYVIDAYGVAAKAGLGVRINTIMQTCFFAISGVLPPDEAIERIKHFIEKTYGKSGQAVVQQNFRAVDAALDHMHQVTPPTEVTATRSRPPIVSVEAPEFVQRVTAVMLAGHGDKLPVSAFPPDGTWPSGTTRWEKRNIGRKIPVWDPKICIQCNHCTLVCPHAAIRAKVYDPSALEGAPASFVSDEMRGSRELKGMRYTLQVAPEDCTGCTLCVDVCPAKDKSNPRHKAIDMAEQAPLREQEGEKFAFFLDLPQIEAKDLPRLDVRHSQLLLPLFEYSGACSGCGETPYIKLVTQLFGDRAIIANATGCSSIYGGNLPTTPYTVDAHGRGPAWSNSLFEDNAEFGYGMRLAVNDQTSQARGLVASLVGELDASFVEALLTADQSDAVGIEAQRERVAMLKSKLGDLEGPQVERLRPLADYLVDKSVWIIGGDGWAYDIGYGGLDHVLGSDANVNILVLDTEVYSNTGGQASKATPLGAVAKFAAAGKTISKKDLGLEAMSYGHVYVARVAFGAKNQQTVRALIEAESYPGPSLVIAYSHCIAHGYDLAHGLEQQKAVVETGIWPLYRFDPRNVAEGKPPLALDSNAPKGSVETYMRAEARFRMVEKMDKLRFASFVTQKQDEARRQRGVYEQLAGITIPQNDSLGTED